MLQWWKKGVAALCMVFAMGSAASAQTNVISNGTFNTDLSGWTNASAGTSWNAASGQAQATGSGSATLTQQFTLHQGRTYTLSFTYGTVGTSTPDYQFQAAIRTGVPGTPPNDLVFAAFPGNQTGSTLAGGTFTGTAFQYGGPTQTGFLRFFAAVAGGGLLFIDNVTLIEVPELSGTTAALPLMGLMFVGLAYRGRRKNAALPTA